MSKEKDLKEELTVDGALYKQMYLRMVKAVMDMDEIMTQALQECEEIFLSENPVKQEPLLIPVVRYLDLRDHTFY